MGEDRMRLRSAQDNPSFGDLLSNPSLLIAFGFGSGLARWMPGTFGTLVGVPIAYLLCGKSVATWLVVVAVLFAVGVVACDRACRHLKTHDHRGVVWDEIVGYVVTMAFVPCVWYLFVLGFFAFRFFDIIKPWPISLIDRKVHGGFGVMIDDVVAGLFALLVVHGFNALSPI